MFIIIMFVSSLLVKNNGRAKKKRTDCSEFLRLVKSEDHSQQRSLTPEYKKTMLVQCDYILTNECFYFEQKKIMIKFHDQFKISKFEKGVGRSLHFLGAPHLPTHHFSITI